MVEHLNKEGFLQKVFDFEKHTDWKYQGELPCLIDFYADWCGPCKMIAPTLENLSAEYDGKLIIYKINTDQEQELAGAFGISSIPSLLFIPKEGKPQMAAGGMGKKDFEKAFETILKVSKVDIKSPGCCN